MASSINASTSGGGGIITTADSTGNLNIQSGGSTVVAVTSAGASVTGTLAVSGGVTLTTTLPVLQGGTGVTTSTGTGAGVHSVGPSISSAVMSTMASSVITSGTSVASTSGTSIDFTSIPSWVKRITVMFNGVSTNGTSPPLVQLGAGTVEATGYNCTGINSDGVAVGGANYTTGFALRQTNASMISGGSLVLTLVASNAWVANGCIGTASAIIGLFWVAGNKTLSGTLDRIRITTVNGTDTFDAGTVNILYE